MLVYNEPMAVHGDINFNSPGHRSSQDGSFFQDDDGAGEMQLTTAISPMALPTSPNKPSAQRKHTGNRHTPTAIYDIKCDDTREHSWYSRRRAQWAVDYDANIAQLDFDDTLATQDIAFVDGAAVAGANDSLVDCGRTAAQAMYVSIGDSVFAPAGVLLNGAAQPLAARQRSQIRTHDSTGGRRSAQMSHSLDMSSGESLFSSANIESQYNQALVAATEAAAAAGALSTDSLDMSTLRNACLTNKRDYCLTFSKMTDSGLRSSALGELNMPNAIPGDAAKLPTIDQEDESASHDTTDFTTWGRIRRSYDTTTHTDASAAAAGASKSHSMPSFSHSKNVSSNDGMCNGAGEKLFSLDGSPVPIYNLSASMISNDGHDHGGPPSLLRVFAAKHQRRELTEEQGIIDRLEASTCDNTDENFVPQPQCVGDHDYVEYYAGDGRYIDMNQNEIGYAPPVEGAAAAGGQAARHVSDIDAGGVDGAPSTTCAADRWQGSRSQATAPPAKPPRTFAALLGAVPPVVNQAVQTSPEHRAQSQSQSHVSRCDQPSQPQVLVLPTVSLDFMRFGDADAGEKTKDAAAADRPMPLFPAAPPFPVDFLNFDGAHGGSQSAASGGAEALARLLAPARQLQPELDRLIALASAGVSSGDARLAEGGQLGPSADAPLLANAARLKLAAAASCFGSAPVIQAAAGALPRNKTEVTLSGSSGSRRVTAPLPRFDQLQPCPLPQPPEPVTGFEEQHSARAKSAEPRSAKGQSDKEGAVHDRDSGLGSSGPSHIEDWDSLATLLPRDVAQTCSFFKSNSQLLTAAAAAAGVPVRRPADLCIDKRHRSARGLRDKQAHRRHRPRSEPLAQHGHCHHGGQKQHAHRQVVVPPCACTQCPCGAAIAPQTKGAATRMRRAQFESIHENEPLDSGRPPAPGRHSVRCCTSHIGAISYCCGTVPMQHTSHQLRHNCAEWHWTQRSACPCACAAAAAPCCGGSASLFTQPHCTAGHGALGYVTATCCNGALVYQRRSTREGSTLQRWRHQKMRSSSSGGGCVTAGGSSGLAATDYYSSCSSSQSSVCSSDDDCDSARGRTNAGDPMPLRATPADGRCHCAAFSPYKMKSDCSAYLQAESEPQSSETAAHAQRPCADAAAVEISAVMDESNVSEIELRRPSAMYSEYELREREPGVVVCPFGSLQNVGAVLRSVHAKVEKGREGRQPCATCYKVRSPTSPTAACPPLWAMPLAARSDYCDCATADVLEERERDELHRAAVEANKAAGQVIAVSRLRQPGLNVEEESVRGTFVYRRKREMVERVECAAERILGAFAKFRAASPLELDVDGQVECVTREHLCPSLGALLADGLCGEVRGDPWNFIRATATLGPATRPVHELVNELCERNLAPSQRLADFVFGLLQQRALDCWLSYASLRAAAIGRHYCEGAFMRHATAAYRSLFDRLIGALQPLGLLPLHRMTPAAAAHWGTAPGGTVVVTSYSLMPTRPAADSRLPSSFTASAIMQKRQGIVPPRGGDNEEQAQESKLSRLPKSATVDVHLQTSVHAADKSVPVKDPPISVQHSQAAGRAQPAQVEIPGSNQKTARKPVIAKAVRKQPPKETPSPKPVSGVAAKPPPASAPAQNDKSASSSGKVQSRLRQPTPVRSMIPTSRKASTAPTTPSAPQPAAANNRTGAVGTKIASRMARLDGRAVR